MSRIYLAHRAFESPGYRGNLGRLRMIERGLQSVCPGTTFVRSLGHTPEDDPATGATPSHDCLRQLAVRLLLGDGRETDQTLPTSCLPPSEEVWLVSDPDATTDEVIALAEEAGIPVRRMDASEQEANAMLGALTAHAGADRPTAQPPDAPPFTHPLQVVQAYWGGATDVLGVRALPIDSVRVQHGTNATALRDRAERWGLRIAAAGGVLRSARKRPGWDGRMERVFELHGRDGLDFLAIAELLGNSDACGVQRRWQWILGEISAVLRGRKAA